MKPTDPRWNDTRVIEGSGNVFADLGFDDAQAQVLALRAEAMLRLSEDLRAQGWTQAEAARHLGNTKPRGPRSEERRLGNRCVRTCSSRWSTDHKKQITKTH